MLNSTFLAGGTADDLRKTAEFILEIGRIASVVPAGVGDIDAFYAATTTAEFLLRGLNTVPAAVLDEPDRINVTRFQVGGDSTCSGTVDMTATTGTLTDGSTVSYSDNLDCTWRIRPEPPLAAFAPPELCRPSRTGRRIGRRPEARGDADAKTPAGQLAAADERVLEPPRRQCIIVSYS